MHKSVYLSSSTTAVTRPVHCVGRMSRLVVVGLFSMLLLGYGVSRAESEEKYEKKGPKVYGYIQVQLLNQPIDTNGDNEVNEGRFRVQRARLSVEGEVNPYVSYEMDIDPRAPEIDGLLRDAYFNVKVNPNHTLRIGQQKTIFGYENQISSSRLYMVNRTELSDNMARAVNLRDIGISLRGRLPQGGGARFEYDVAVVNGAGSNVQRDNNKDKNFWGRVGYRSKREGTKWQLGVSGAIGDQFEPFDTPAEGPEDGGFFIDYKRVGVDFLVDHSRVAVNGEFAIGPQKEEGEEETINAYYLTLIGKTSRPVGPLLRYETFNTDEFTRWTVGAYYGKPRDDVRILFNYEFRFEEAEDDAVVENSADDRLYLWMQVRF